MSDEKAPPLASSPGAMERLNQRLVRWRLLDSKFRQNKLRYLAQTCGVAVTMLVVLLALDSVSQTVLIASLGASAFIAFAVPRSYASRPRALLGGYLVGTAVGSTLSLLSIWLAPQVGAELHTLQIVCGAIAVGLCFFIMVVMDTEHPPAVALALGYVLNDWNIITVLVVLSGILALSLVKEAFRSKLMDLM